MEMDELAQIAIAAFRAGKYLDAIDLLLQVSDVEPNDYVAKFYLAMSYHRYGRIPDAQRLLKRLSACSDPDIATKAGAELALVEENMRKRFAKEPVLDITQNVNKQ